MTPPARAPARRSSGRRVAVAWLGLVGLGGCYNYFPVTEPDPRPGMHVAVELTDSGTAVMARYLGPDVRSVDGRLVTLTPDEVGLAVLAVKQRNGIEHYWKGEPVTLPRGEIASLRERKLAPGRSAFLVLAGVGGSVALLQAFGVFGAGTASSGGSSSAR